MTLHHCTPDLPHQGYGPAITACIEDKQSRLWVTDQSGRKATQVQFCPFCGFQAFNATAPERPMQVTPNEIALTPKDRPDRVWKQYHQPITMSHFQFGTVRILASDGCHAKVLTELKGQVTVCVENLEPLAGVPCLPKIGVAKEDKPKRDRHAIDPEKLNKYLNMGL